MPSVRIHLLGAPRIEAGGEPIEVDTRKAIALAAYLAIRGEPQPRDKLAAIFWPESDSPKAHAALRRTLSALNKALAGRALEIDREAVGLSRSGGVWLDVDEFQARLAECRSHGHAAGETCPRCLEPLEKAARLYRDDFLSGFSLRDSPAFDDWQFFQAEGLRRDLAGALERLVACHAQAGQAEAAIPHARRWLALDPIHEPAHRQLMTLYAQAGQRAAALRQYQECARVLDQELGVPPLAETTELFEAIRDNRLAPEAEPAPPAAAEAPAPPRAPLVGRAPEWNRLSELLAAAEGGGEFVVLEGEAGIGKTRLAEGMLDHARERGLGVISARCFEGEHNLAYGPIVELLRGALRQPPLAARALSLEAHHLSEAARLLPELAAARPGLPDAPPLDGPGAQSRFFEGIVQLLMRLAGERRMVIALDDVHWMDAASLDLLAFLLRRQRGARLSLLAMWREELVPAGHRLRQMLADAQRAGLGHCLTLARLDQAAVAELVRSASGDGQTAQLAERLYRETEGLPLFVVEYLAAMQHEPADGEWSLPVGVRGLLQSRLAAAGAAARQLLSAAAVIGRTFDFDLLQAVSGRSADETLSGLESLAALGIVTEASADDGSPRYDFRHDKLRALAYDETSLTRRRVLHRRAAEALAARARGGRAGGPLASQVAQHYRRGGQSAEAAHYSAQAGDHARELYANAEAVELYGTALSLGHADAARLHEAIGDLHTLAGQYDAALADYEAAAAQTDADALAGLEHKLGNVYVRRGDAAAAEPHFEAALEILPEDAAGERARVLADWSLAAHQQGHAGRAHELAEQSLTLAEAAADQRALAQAHNILGILATRQQAVAAAAGHLERSLELAEALGDEAAQAAALNNLALARRAGGQLEAAVELTERALALCAAQGDRHRQAALHNNLADVLHAAGRDELAMAHLKQAVGLFAEVGASAEAEADRWRPGIWHLTEW